ncbi:type II toxin-antitoxin system VapC family toxin [Profundibacterium mesophilum]|uniref:Ribonuclease VapC n=1 Tax=Profundibacterium mesophilum KAUST100406-0324 TaxID=1037889 RepID=A0A921TC20_9RHOB|nr:type II toxin-antitoxin system VapC family toxin [Profundibacterium mesophilum]KAF0674581.1 serine O-acetyltransferase [Profundibacterium mesophilum KAUST100406-0324]
MIILDTNVLSALRRTERAPQVARWLAAQEDAALRITSITIGEIERGIAMQERRDPQFAADLRQWIDRTMLLFGARILPFGADEARIWGRLSARLGHDGADLMIAACALSHDAVIATRNIADFAPTGARLVDPFAAVP